VVNSYENKEIFAAFNLDWPWPVLSPYFVPVSFKSHDGKKEFVNLTVPGYLGVLRGMNEDGVVVGCCQAGHSRQNGLPVTLLFRDLLENSATAAEAERRLQELRPASSMNLIIAGKDGIFSVELDPHRSQRGFAAIRRG
jgi:predicted choloylglycine hydrolase